MQSCQVLLLNKITKIESNSQPTTYVTLQGRRCFYWTKLQKLKAIHNENGNFNTAFTGAFTEQNYKNWKQFTTRKRKLNKKLVVLLLNKITKIESNSQLTPPQCPEHSRCFYWTKLQKLKAIHNLRPDGTQAHPGAFTEQNYKNWKQFTTWRYKYRRP